MRNIHKLSTYVFALCSFFSLCACSNKKTEPDDAIIEKTMQISELHKENDNLKSSSKLNFDDALVNIPDTDVAYEMKLTVSMKDNEEYVNQFTEAYEKFTGKELNKDDVLLGFGNGDGTFQNVKYKDSPGFKGDFFQMSYRSDDEIFESLAMTYFSSILITNYQKISESSIQLGNVQNVIYFGSSKDNDKNALKLAENANDLLSKNYPYFFESDAFEFKPFHYQKSDNIYYFMYQPIYENIPLNTDFFSAIGESVSINDTAAFREVVIDTDHNFYRFNNFPDFNVEKTETFTELISPQYACSLVEEEISDDVQFMVSRFDLVYNYCQFNDDDANPIYWESRPYWKITIDKSGIPNYPMLVFIVDAITGEVKSYQKV